MSTSPRMAFRLGSLLAVLSIGLLQGQFKEPYFGSNGDGFGNRTIGPTTLTNQSLAVLFEGSNGDGFDNEQRLGTTLTNGSIEVLFDGSNGDGFSSRTLAGTTLTNDFIEVLFEGSNGDGFSSRTLAGTTLTNDSIEVLFEGSNGDGFSSRILVGTTLTNDFIEVLFGGSNGDGFDLLQQNGLKLVPVPDSDGDLIPNDWENLYSFLNPNNPNDAALDFDGDGVSNLDEYLADTLPNDAFSFFCIKIRSDGGGGYEVYYDTSANRYYRLETADDLMGWGYAGPSILGTGGEISQPLPAGSNEFGRVLVAPAPID